MARVDRDLGKCGTTAAMGRSHRTPRKTGMFIKATVGALEGATGNAGMTCLAARPGRGFHRSYTGFGADDRVFQPQPASGDGARAGGRSMTASGRATR